MMRLARFRLPGGRPLGLPLDPLGKRPLRPGDFFEESVSDASILVPKLRSTIITDLRRHMTPPDFVTAFGRNRLDSAGLGCYFVAGSDNGGLRLLVGKEPELAEKIPRPAKENAR